MLYQILKHAHSGLRWLVLLFIVSAIVSALVKLMGNKKYTSGDRKLGVLSLAFTHTQIIIGLVLYFISGKVVFSGQSMSNDLLRFFLVEHIGMMLIAAVLITIGYVKTKKANLNSTKLKRTLIFFGIGLLVMLLAIPWPWQLYGAWWY